MIINLKRDTVLTIKKRRLRRVTIFVIVGLILTNITNRFFNISIHSWRKFQVLQEYSKLIEKLLDCIS